MEREDISCPRRHRSLESTIRGNVELACFRFMSIAEWIGKVIDLFGEGKQHRDMNYVDDVVEALLLTGASEATDGEIYNLGAPDPVSVAELAAELVSLTGRGQLRAVPFPPERQLIDIGNFYSSYSKIEKAIGWRPRTSLRTGLALTIDYYKKYGQHYLEPEPDGHPVSGSH